MKIPTLLCTTACALLLAGGAAAHETGKPHKHRSPEGADREAGPTREAEGPYAAYWNDPGRAAPPFSYYGRGI